jgi:hypothetical protein
VISVAISVTVLTLIVIEIAFETAVDKTILVGIGIISPCRQLTHFDGRRRVFEALPIWDKLCSMCTVSVRPDGRTLSFLASNCPAKHPKTSGSEFWQS